ncbi:low affinity immunoglobulin epsilon Fc receptor-like [Ptychodera flava]|uniref:low affinity immunoglobulin epsilon Fc receptor-like n=1 Tax=Ptychodera flava TaxID=63121 RepID=UPI00396A9AA7
MLTAVAFLLALSAIAECAEYGPVCSSIRYRVYTDQLLWVEAEAKCKELGGSLAKLADKERDDLVRNYLNDEGLGDEVDAGYWVGLNDRKVEGTFVWLDGEKWLECGSYSNWAPGEPNNNEKHSDDGQDCVQLRSKKQHRWDDDFCEHRPKGYVCQFIECGVDCERCIGI